LVNNWASAFFWKSKTCAFPVQLIAVAIAIIATITPAILAVTTTLHSAPVMLSPSPASIVVITPDLTLISLCCGQRAALDTRTSLQRICELANTEHEDQGQGANYFFDHRNILLINAGVVRGSNWFLKVIGMASITSWISGVCALTHITRKLDVQIICVVMHRRRLPFRIF
jgi:hypothetical protein